MKDIDRFRRELIGHIKDSPLLNQITESVTIVGSFHTKNDISVFSDIDTIILVDKLTKSKFDQIINYFSSISLEQFGLYDYQVIVNSTFGPLKFNQENVLVFHVMIYDVNGHRKHVIDSPFTCYEWQQHQSIIGKDLQHIYPSNALSLTDISASRRGFLSYLEDLQKQVITYRSYVFINDEVIEEKRSFELDKKHQFEYAYHILKFLMKNILSITYQKCHDFEDTQLVNQFTIFDPSFQNLSDLYSSLSELKGNSKAQVHISLAAIHDQVILINSWFERFLNDLPRLYFYRHLSTDLNDGRFLGIFSDPAINNSKIDVDSSIEICYTSQLKRAIQTAELLTSCPKAQTPLLNEINYGKADGMTYDELKDRFSEIVVAWNQQKDMCFPDGENMADVKERLEMFIIENIAHSPNKVIGIVTHNVFLRVLLAKLFSVSLIGAYKFQINHGEKIVCRYWNGNLIPELTNEQRIRFREQYLEWPNH